MSVITTITWREEDLCNALKEHGYEPSKENVEKLLSTMLSKNLVEGCVSTGWDIIADKIQMTEGLVKI